MEGAGQVDGDHSIPTLNGEVFNTRHMLNASVVDQDVNTSKFVFSKLHHGLDFGGFAHVCAVVGHFGAQSRNFGLGSSMVAKTVQNDVGALFCQGFGNAQANATGRAGHECGFAFQHGVLRMIYDVEK